MNRSEDITLLAKAIAIAQGEFPKVTKDSANPFFKTKYMNLATLIDAVQPVLSKNGLAVVQSLETELVFEKTLMLRISTHLIHTSGQFIESTLSIPVLEIKPQTIGSTSTYGRRYALQSILRIAADEDDDGNAASGGPRMEPEAAKAYAGEQLAHLHTEHPDPEPPLTMALRKSVEALPPKPEQTVTWPRDYQEDAAGYATFTLTRVQSLTTKKNAPYRKLYWNGGSAQCFKPEQFEEIDALRPGQRVAVSGVCHNGAYVDFAKVEGAISPEQAVEAIAEAHGMPKAEDYEIPY